MVYEYQYTSTNKLNGILRYFYDQGNEIYENVLEYFATSINSNDPKFSPQYAFDFDSNNYWLGDENTEFTNLSFCLKNYYVKINGFEISTSNLDSLPKQFEFSSSLNNKTYINTKEYDHSFIKSDIHYFSYSSKISNCFKLTCIQSINGYTVFDVNNIEIYGKFSSNIRDLLDSTCENKKSFFSLKLIFIFILK